MKTWSVKSAAKAMEVPESYVKECISKNILVAGPRGGVTEESLDKYFEDALFTPQEATDSIQVEIGVIEDCIEDGFLPTYKAWNSTRIRGKDLDKLNTLINTFLEYEEKETSRGKRLKQEVNTRAKWITNSQGNRCFICSTPFLKIPEYWMSREFKDNFEVHAICELCSKQQKKNN